MFAVRPPAPDAPVQRAPAGVLPGLWGHTRPGIINGISCSAAEPGTKVPGATCSMAGGSSLLPEAGREGSQLPEEQLPLPHPSLIQLTNVTLTNHRCPTAPSSIAASRGQGQCSDTSCTPASGEESHPLLLCIKSAPL